MSTKQKGDYGEVVAIKYLQTKGYLIETTNLKFGRFGEIDIVAKKDGITIFFEVKYRFGDKFGTPEEAITKSKLRKFRRTIDYYCAKNNIDFGLIRFDVIAIIRKETSNQVTHYRNVEI
ncbi:MAG: YraN family protein [Candidatus Gracilibacteria bacterium]|nr:YraN family protein [Candidatus Gracilibacteria bacterium]MDQ7022773.1 YraN family protein [Candidatus Gracilibacteria bacterium]